MSARTLALLGVALLAGGAIGRATGDRWMGFVYPDTPSLIRHIAIGEFRTLEECRGSAIAVANGLGERHIDYECGLNCEAPRREGGPRLCEQTER